MRGRRSMNSILLGAALALGLAGCDDGVGVGEARVSVLLTDASADYIDEALVDIGRVELVGGSGGPVTLSEDGTDGMVNLMDLRDAVTTTLATADVEADTYSQLRLIVEAASVKLLAPHEFNDGSSTKVLTIPSGAQTGIKLNLEAAADDADGGGVEISGDMVFVVDVDVTRSYVMQGNPETPAGLESMSFKPTMRVVVEAFAGSVSGTVTTSVPGLDVEGMIVTAEPVEETLLEPYQSESPTALVNADGTYTLYFVVPGEYSVSVDAVEGNGADPVDVMVDQGERVVGVDFAVEELPIP